jgi:DNA polymerase-3 subunit epsilon
MYAIIDIETTGGNPFYDKITDICVIIHDGINTIETFSTLINPERNIPQNITFLTGISNQMVQNAPKFFEVAKKIIEITQGQIFVAHNVNFDYNFIVQEFKSLGYSFKREKLCTVKLSRKLIPNKKSYSLGNLCQEIGIEITHRHRAHGDALATAKLFELLCSIKENHQIFKNQELDNLYNTGILGNKASLLTKLPEQAGVYFFLDENQQIIYIGKSKNIRARAFAHLQTKTKKALKIVDVLHDVDYVLTGSELIALLMETEQIQEHLPPFNNAGKQKMFSHELTYLENSSGVINFKIKPFQNSKNLLLAFNSSAKANEKLKELIDVYELCHKQNSDNIDHVPCLDFQMKKCKGICCGKENHENYNLRAKKIIKNYGFENQSFAIVDKGRNDSEKSFVLVIEGKYQGYGYLDQDTQINSLLDLKEFLESSKFLMQANSIIKQQIKANPYLKIIK